MQHRLFKIIAVLAAVVGACLLVFLLKSGSRSSENPRLPLTEVPDSNGSRATSATVADEYEVYSALLSDPWYVDDNTREVMISEETYSPTLASGDDLAGSMTGLGRDTVEDFNQKVSLNENHKLTCEFTLKAKCVLLSKEHRVRALQKGWGSFYSEHTRSKGIITLSNVGFNSDVTEALVCVGLSCGGLCGHECFLLLEKKDGAWLVKCKRITVMGISVGSHVASNNSVRPEPRKPVC